MITSQDSNNIILSLTFLALVWYSWETRRMVNQIVKQNKLQLSPFLVVYFRGDGAAKKFRIRNLGRGVALNIQIKKVVLSQRERIYIIFNLPGTNALKSEEERDLKFDILHREERISAKMLPNLDPEFANRDYNLKTEYEDINGDKYITILKTGKSGVKVEEYLTG